MANLIKEPQLSSIWLINSYSHLQQGTSRNENFHHFINGKNPRFVGYASFYLLTAMLHIVVLIWNKGYTLYIN